MKGEEFKFYSDPGNGWLAVKRDILIRLGIEDKISDYSYQSQTGKTVYLEEDMDAGLFFKAYRKVYGKSPNFIEVNYNFRAPIRTYNGFSKLKLEGESPDE